MEDAVYHAMKDRRKQLERSSESRHSAQHIHTHAHTTRMHAHTVYSKTRHTVQYMLEADWTLNYLLFEIQLLSSCDTALSTTEDEEGDLSWS